MATIVKLPDSTIQMIAAGEVITKPSNVIKELLENSLDAGATNVRIIIHNGGLKFIEIIDNGHGISRANAELLCHRYATSKLRTADDLSRISTFGFRGEALASVSEVANIRVKTFNMGSDKSGWEAEYRAGEVFGGIADKYLQQPGTQIKVSDLFKKLGPRRAAIKASIQDEKKSIIDLVMKHAIHHRENVTMSLKEKDMTDSICVLAPMSAKSCIGMFFGMDFENNVIEIPIKKEEPFKAEVGMIFSYKKSGGNLQQSSFILFVNDRLVECNALKREVESIANEYFSSKQYAILSYISLKVPPHDVDVNTHPAKATVTLHFQDEIVSLIVNAMMEKFAKNLDVKVIFPTTQQRTIGELTQPILLKASPQRLNLTEEAEKRLRIMAPGSLTQPRPYNSSVLMTSTPTKRPHDLIHNDSSQPTIKQIVPPRRPRRDLKLRSITELRQLVAKEKSQTSAGVIKNSTFVGIFDHSRALIQHETKLYAINLKAFLKEQYYQFYLFDFGNFPPIEILPPGNKIKFMISIHLDDLRQHDNRAFTQLKFKTPESVLSRLSEKAEMLEDYISLKFTHDEILTIPCIMPEEIPNLVYLGRFLVNLANHVDYSEERNCLRTIGRIIAEFYSEPPANLKDEEVHRSYHNLIESKIYVAIKNYMLIPEWLFTRENICQISDTKDLYKVFERC